MGRGDIAEGLHELAAVHHKGLVKFIQHLSDLAQQRIEQTQHPYQQIGDRTHPGGQLSFLEEEGEHLARGQRRCVGNMPALAKRFLMRAKQHQPFPEIGDIGVRMGHIQLTQNRHGLAIQQGRDDPVAKDAL